MLKTSVAELLSIRYEKRLLIFDLGEFWELFDYAKLLRSEGFQVYYYHDVESFRLLFETEIRNTSNKCAVIVNEDRYVPYDIRSTFYEVVLSIPALFPKLDEAVILKSKADLGIISFTYNEVFVDKLSAAQTQDFIEDKVFNRFNVKNYCELVLASVFQEISAIAISYSQWFEIAKLKASLEVYEARVGIRIDMSFVDEAFINFLLDDYKKLSGYVSGTAPVILPKVLDFIAKDRTALIVMDGMSLFDFNILSRYFDGIEYEFYCTYALIPTTTAISRQCLLSGKYPVQLESPFTLGKEEKEFYDSAARQGFNRQQTAYINGYDVRIGPFTKLLAIVLNDIDDIAHSQKQGRQGMFNDITLLAKSSKLQQLIRSLYKMGFTVYLTSDHGNTLCKGIGILRNVGVEAETKAKRMMILKDFAHMSDELIENTIEYPAYYLNKSYRYLICKTGISFDSKNDEVITHGGISTDEVIVPFVKIKAVN